MIVMSCDPGTKGGFAVFTGSHAFVFPLQYEKEIDKNLALELRERMSICNYFVIEQQWQRPGNGAASSAASYTNYGILLGIAKSLKDTELIKVSPQKWKKGLNLSKDKQQSIDLAKQLYPGIELKLPGKRVRKESDGLAEALLIGHYAINYLIK